MSRVNDIYQKIKKDKEKAIDDYILTRKSEELFLDFKRSADNGSGRILHQNDRNNLAKAISGFGNSEGGVIVWGVDCSRQANQGDVAGAKFPLSDVKKYVSLLEGAISGLTLPPHSQVENYVIKTGSNEEGFVATYIPQNLELPIRTVYNKQFYVRAGSNFEPIPYQVLAGMFGRKPQPFVFINYTIGPAEVVDGGKIKVQAGFLFHNRGPGIAKDLFVNASIKSFPGDDSQLSFETPDLQNWTGGWSFGRFMSLISKPKLRLPPESHVQPLILNMLLHPPFNDGFEISIMCGSENATPMKSSLSCSKNNLTLIYKKFVKLDKEGKLSTKDRHQAAQEILGRE